jgi:hypothetical protein
VTLIPREAREALTRVWLEILRERHPDTSWIPAGEAPTEEGSPTKAQDETTELLSAA